MPKWALFSRLVCRVGWEYKEQYNNHIQWSTYPIFRPARNCEHIRNVWLATSGTVIAAWNRVRLVTARRGPGFLDFEGSGLPISVVAWPASAERGWLGMGRLVPVLSLSMPCRPGI